MISSVTATGIILYMPGMIFCTTGIIFCTTGMIFCTTGMIFCLPKIKVGNSRVLSNYFKSSLYMIIFFSSTLFARDEIFTIFFLNVLQYSLIF